MLQVASPDCNVIFRYDGATIGYAHIWPGAIGIDEACSQAYTASNKIKLFIESGGAPQFDLKIKENPTNPMRASAQINCVINNEIVCSINDHTEGLKGQEIIDFYKTRWEQWKALGLVLT